MLITLFWLEKMILTENASIPYKIMEAILIPIVVGFKLGILQVVLGTIFLMLVCTWFYGFIKHRL